jgi:hypothetical protein
MPKPRSVEGDRGKEEIAARIVAAAQGHVNVPEAMKMVKLSTPIRTNDTVRRRVLRRAKKLEQEAKENPAVLLAAPIEEIETTNPSSSDTGAVSSITGQSHETSSTGRLDEVRRSLNLRLPPEGVEEEAASSEKSTTSRRTSKNVQKDDALLCKKRKIEARGTKAATTRIRQNMMLSPTNPKKKSQAEIVREVNEAFGSNVNAKTAARMVKEGRVGVSPLKRGPVGNFPKHIWNPMKNAFVSFVKLELANSTRQSSLKDHSKRVNALVNKGGFNKSGYELVRKLKKETADELEVGKKNVVEQRRVKWTSYSNLHCFYEMWEETLVSLGFGRKKEPTDPPEIEGNIFFFPGQRRRILNFDETDGTLDNCNGQRGGRPPIVFYASDISGGATQASKSSYSPTIICGSNAAGEALPPHFQLKTTAQTDDGKKINVDFIMN